MVPYSPGFALTKLKVVFDVSDIVPASCSQSFQEQVRQMLIQEGLDRDGPVLSRGLG